MTSSHLDSLMVIWFLTTNQTTIVCLVEFAHNKIYFSVLECIKVRLLCQTHGYQYIWSGIVSHKWESLIIVRLESVSPQTIVSSQRVSKSANQHSTTWCHPFRVNGLEFSTTQRCFVCFHHQSLLKYSCRILLKNWRSGRMASNGFKERVVCVIFSHTTLLYFVLQPPSMIHPARKSIVSMQL